MDKEWDSNDPEVIRAKAEAAERELAAVAKLSPLAQGIRALHSLFIGCVQYVGCLLIVLVILLGMAGVLPQLISAILGR